MLFSCCFTGCLGWERPAVADTQASSGWDPEVRTASFPNPSLQIWGPHHSHKLGSLRKECARWELERRLTEGKREAGMGILWRQKGMPFTGCLEGEEGSPLTKFCCLTQG